MEKEVDKYPIKYALLPLGVKKVVKDDLKYFCVVGYIVSKVYVKKETITYFEDGSPGLEYDVAFPKTIIIETDEFNKSKIDIQLIDKPFPISTGEVFDNYDQARERRDDKNQFFPEINDYLAIEDLLLNYTQDLQTFDEQRYKELSIIEQLMGDKEKPKIKVLKIK